MSLAVRRLAILGAFIWILVGLSRPAYGAGTYYIDCAQGNDTNSGTSTAAPWKHDPTMPGSAVGGYSHSAGDTFYFKGGVTCAVNSNWTIGTGGSSSAFDYRGATPTWGTGTTSGYVTTNGTSVYQYGDFTHTGQPFITLGGAWNGKAITINGTSYTISSCATQRVCTLTTSAGVQSAPVAYSVSGAFALPIIDYSGTSAWTSSAMTIGASFNTIDSIEFKNWSTKSPSNYGQSMFFVYGAYTVTLSNNHIHDWGTTACSGDCASDGNGDGIFGGNGASITAIGNTMHARQDSGTICQKTNGTSYCSTGNAMYGVDTVIGNYVYDVFAFMHSGSLFHDNYMAWMNSGEDSAVHENGIYTFGSFSAYNNVIHDFIGVPAIYWETYGGSSPVPTIANIYNNVIWNASQPLLAEPDRAPVGGPYNDVQNIWNNTIVAPGGNCVRTTPRGTNSGTWNLHNNHCISNQALATSFNSANSTTFNLAASNVVMTTTIAGTQGYSAAQAFAFSPTSSANMTITLPGDDLSSLCSGAQSALCWDTSYADARTPAQRSSSGWKIGAYALSGGTTTTAVNPPSGLVAIVN